MEGLLSMGPTLLVSADALTMFSLHSNRKLATFLTVIHDLDSIAQIYLIQERLILVLMQLAASLVQHVHWRNNQQPLKGIFTCAVTKITFRKDSAFKCEKRSLHKKNI